MPEREIKIHINSWKILTLILLVLTLFNTYSIYANHTPTNISSTTTTTVSKLQISSGDTPPRGPANAKVTIIEFSDFECPYCASAEPLIQQILNSYPNDVKLYYRNFPLTQLHPDAMNAAMSAECANEQGKFWEMHDKLFANQQALGVINLKQYAKDVGLDTAQFNTCLDSNKYQSQITKDTQDGLAAGVGGTPSFFVDGIPVQSSAQFTQIITSELGK